MSLAILEDSHILRVCPARRLRVGVRKGSAWNKGRTAATDKRIKLYAGNEIGLSISEGLKRYYAINPAKPTKGTGKGKRGWYLGYWCDSSWELAWVMFNLDHNIPFKRNLQGFQYTYGGQTRLFYPDFIVDGGYVEIKGWSCDQTESKLTQFRKLYSLTLLGQKEIQPYLEHAKRKYGKDFVKLYSVSKT